ncbi:hypothetical protein [Rhodopila sp.]|uniref:hypothetical protein n=1 Tax=Rhodopila sp. TaxID=2480087 RepID=UPI002C902F64|nr:hypothetical protein [Rhodopila sp.]HVZ09193.1 hypothetical protein [Rhodopila sp.]
MARILLIQWSGSAYDSLRFILDLTAAEMAADGHRIERVIIGENGWQQRLRQLIQQQGPWQLALGMSGVGLELGMENGPHLWDTAKIPFFTWFCDHPAYFPARHMARSPYSVMGYVFPDHARYARDHLNANGVTFAVHLGMPSRATFPDAARPLDRRNDRIAFFKSGADDNALRTAWRQSLPSPLAHLMDEAAEACAGTDVAGMVAELQRAGERHDVFLAPDGKLCLALLQRLDAFERPAAPTTWCAGCWTCRWMSTAPTGVISTGRGSGRCCARR